jgi:PAS domain S-box-containing protein
MMLAHQKLYAGPYQRPKYLHRPGASIRGRLVNAKTNEEKPLEPFSQQSAGSTRSEEVLRKHQEILQLVHNIGKIGHWEWNAQTDENKWSPEIEALYGLPPGGFKGGYAGWAELLHPDDLAKAEADVRRALETGEYFTEFRVIWPDGSVHWLETRAKMFKDGQGKPERMVGVNMDVTDRKRVEEQLRQSQLELQQRIDQLADTDRHKNP